MTGSKERIDYLDLSIEISQVAEPFFEGLLELFADRHIHVEVTPSVKSGILHINSNDLIALIGYINEDDLSELELHRFRQAGEYALDQALLRSVSLHHQAHYKWCLAALKSFDIGRFL